MLKMFFIFFLSLRRIYKWKKIQPGCIFKRYLEFLDRVTLLLLKYSPPNVSTKISLYLSWNQTWIEISRIRLEMFTDLSMSTGKCNKKRPIYYVSRQLKFTHLKQLGNGPFNSVSTKSGKSRGVHFIPWTVWDFQ